MSAAIIEQIHQLSPVSQLELLQEYLDHENTDLYIVIQTWNKATDILETNSDILESTNEQLNLSSRASILLNTILSDIKVKYD